MRLLLIRHAQSTNNLLYAETGGSEGRSHDPPLTPLGHQQAQALADFARTDPTFQAVTHLYSSLTTRAVQTAAPLAAALGLGVQGLAHAHETGGLFLRDESGAGYGVPGKTHAELLTENPALRWPADLSAADAWAGGFEREGDEAAFLARAARVLEDLRAAHGPEDVAALVTHGHFTQFLLRSLLGHGAAYFMVYNTSTTLLTLPAPDALPDWGPLVGWVNRFDHLGADLLSQ
ncbi:histidine phosphatase family protein [Deinococcus sp. VB343]|uniref:Histidine phosphatase family protein n=1 Tax=Deinococcus sp. VB142 TaxID=3112952 RepID=A0AAU6PZR5_9DEIO